jgi:subtilisin family serine protease
MPRRPDARTRVAKLTPLAVLATALVATGAVQGAGESAVQTAARAWHAVFGDRPAAAFGERKIVVLSLPSLAERVAAAERPPSAAAERRWTRDAHAQQRAFVLTLRERGIRIERDFVYTRVLNGFSAALDSRALAELERNPSVVGIYPVRAVYPAAAPVAQAVTSDASLTLPGFDGSGATVALLDTGVAAGHPALAGRVGRGVDLVEHDGNAEPSARPDDPARVENHGTRMAGLVASVAPGVQILPIRVVGWNETASGYASVGRGDVLVAGLERAVDRNADGAVDDAADIAAVPLVEPFAGFTDSPESRAVAGAAELGTLVVAAAGNDGPSGTGFGSVAAPGSAPAALTVGALDDRPAVPASDVVLTAAGKTAFAGPVRVLGAEGAATPRDLAVTGLLGPSLTHPSRARGAASSGVALGDFFDPRGVSRVAGRAVIIAADGRPLAEKARNAAAAGAAALVVFGTAAPAGALDVSPPLPVVAVPGGAGADALAALRDGRGAAVRIGAARGVGNAGAGRVAAFSSGGLAFDGTVKPDVVAPGVALETADPAAAGSVAVSGTSAAAAVTAGAAALLAQARPDLSAAQLESALVGSATRLADTALTEQGAGRVDVRLATTAEVAVEPAVLSFGRAGEAGWSSSRPVTVENLSTRPLTVGFGLASDPAADGAVHFTAEPARLTLGPGARADVTLGVSLDRALSAGASGTLVVSAEGARPVRVPWAIAPRPNARLPLVDSVELSNWAFTPSNAAPTVLAFRAGRAAPGPAGARIEPVGVLDVELWTTGGKNLGVLARLRDLLPGRYALGLTGRGPDGDVLHPGTYVLRLRAYAVDAEDGALPSTAQAVIRIERR